MHKSAQHDAASLASPHDTPIGRDGEAGVRRTVAIVQTQAENAGAQEVARQLAQGFEKRGWRVRQVFLYRRTESFDADANVFFCARSRPSSPLGVLRMLVELFKEFRREAPDTVITLQHYGNIIAAPVARLAGARLIIANQLTPSELIPAPVSVVDRIMGSIGLFDHIIVNSAQTELCYRSYPAPYARRITRIDHGFFDKSAPIAKTDARRQLGFPQAVELLGCAARLHPRKQIDFAIRALVFDDAQHLAIAGQGQDYDRLVDIAEALGVANRVHFLGELNTAQIGVFLAAIDCFVFPSAIETFGLAAVEAAQAGAPVVANDIDVLRDVLAAEGEPCALFVDARDARALSAAVRRALDDAALRDQLTSRGRRLANRFPLDAMIDGYASLMEPKPK
jgi:glycosyltransferase involved in cell wall biosynthesis